MTRASLKFPLAAMLLAAFACGKPSRSSSNPAWAPEKLTSVSGVPATDIESAIKSRLAGPPPAQIAPDQWNHTRRIYKLYGGNALWLTSNGLHKTRPLALMNGILNAENDAIRIDAYPLSELARSVAAVKDNPNPTAQQLADADVILTAAYTTLGENLL